MTLRLTLLLLVPLLAACNDDTGDAGVPASSPANASAPPPASPPQATEPLPKAAERLAVAQWRKAENRESCAPLAFTGTGDTAATARPATFAGGWAIAFDLPGLRSAYGVAGTGHVPGEAEVSASQRRRLFGQWPLFRDLPDLPAPAFAGYGYEGEQAYDEAAAARAGGRHLAYVRIGGQACDYNVWSHLGRAHLETLLANLRMAEPPAP